MQPKLFSRLHFNTKWLALITLAFGTSMVIIDNTIITIAVPYILRDFHTSLSALEWVLAGYSLIIATLIITMGRVVDIWGRKKIFLTGIGIFAVGTAIASFAQNVPMLFVGETLLEGIGAAMIFPSALALITAEFGGKQRAHAFGIAGAVTGVASIIGPILGGYITTHYSWHWSLRINVVLAVLILFGSRFVKESKGKTDPYFDWRGTIYSGCGLFLLLLACIEGSQWGWWVPKRQLHLGSLAWPLTSISLTPFVLLVGSLFILKFIATEKRLERRRKNPLLKLSLFKKRAFRLGLLTVGTLVMGQYGSLFILPLFFQKARGFDALGIGFILLPVAASMVVFGLLSGHIASRIGVRKVIIIGAFLLCAGTFGLIGTLTPNANVGRLLIPLILLGTGTVMATGQITTVIMSSVPVTYAGEASSTNVVTRQLAVSLAVVLVGLVFTGAFVRGLQRTALVDPSLTTTTKQKLTQQLETGSLEFQALPINPLSEQDKVREKINETFVQASRQSLIFMLAILIFGTVSALTLPKTVISKSH